MSRSISSAIRRVSIDRMSRCRRRPGADRAAPVVSWRLQAAAEGGHQERGRHALSCRRCSWRRSGRERVAQGVQRRADAAEGDRQIVGRNLDHVGAATWASGLRTPPSGLPPPRGRTPGRPAVGDDQEQSSGSLSGIAVSSGWRDPPTVRTRVIDPIDGSVGSLVRPLLRHRSCLPVERKHEAPSCRSPPFSRPPPRGDSPP